MEVHLVRHACAGRKGDWPGPDVSRPLDEVGRAQARDLADHLDGVPIRRLLASPAARCVQTLDEVAVRHGLVLETTAVLAADADPELLQQALADPALADAVLCTHGETLKALLPLLRRSATRVQADADDDGRLLLKGSVWTLTVEPGADPAVTELRHAVPSEVESCAEHPRWEASEPLSHGV
jgi:8-oxo-dGTP diphosphatase